MKFASVLSISLLLSWGFCALAVDFEEVFTNATVGREPGNNVDWVIYDEAAGNLDDKGPSSWEIMNSPLDGPAMSQSSNIWGDVTDAVAIGSFVIYDKAEWADFSLEVEIVANDNDGMGLVWRWQDRQDHYRYMTMLDTANSPNGRHGPYRVIERRLGDGDANNNGKADGEELPFYETLVDNKDSYLEGTPQTWKLEAVGDTFKFYVDDKLTLEAKDSTYKSGKVGFVVYAQSGLFFDNMVIKDLLQSVDSLGKLTSKWSDIKNR